MSIKKKAVALLGCAALAFSLIGCQQGEKKEPEPTDVQLMQDTGDARIDEPFYVLVVGSDSRTGTVEIDKPDYADGSGRSDTTMLVRIDPETYQVGIVTIPRDTAISLNGQTTKFNEAYCVGGIEETLHQVKLPTGISPLYYMDMSFVQFEKFVNELGGLTANVPIDMGLQDIVSGARSRFLRACRTSTARNRLFCTLSQGIRG
ncbi:LCP family protein [Paraeggerthella hominis]|uniref:LCP family protein n=1 Tax=Paraeggerthella hominis TaxID=2897351 RepID=UPI003D0B4229